LIRSLQEVTLSNQFGMTVSVLNFGARIISIKLPVNEQLEEMTVTHKDAQDYLTDEYFIGATCGPVANRLAKAQFVTDDKLYKVSANNGENCLHGGEGNFSNSYWEIDENTLSESYIKLSLNVADLEGGFPGNRVITVEYNLTEDNQLVMVYTGRSDKTTPINMTNHVYFSLGQTSCLPLNLSIASSSFLELFDDGIPTGEIMSIKALGTNIKNSHVIEDIIAKSTYPQVCREEGVDHCFIIDNKTIDKPNAVLYSKANGVKLQVYSDQPTMQVYTGNYLAEPLTKHAGVCLECHGFVDAPNQANFTDVTYEKADLYRSKIVYGFSLTNR
jgi:aldose 1-epimerase